MVESRRETKTRGARKALEKRSRMRKVTSIGTRQAAFGQQGLCVSRKDGQHV